MKSRRKYPLQMKNAISFNVSIPAMILRPRQFKLDDTAVEQIEDYIGIDWKKE